MAKGMSSDNFKGSKVASKNLGKKEFAKNSKESMQGKMKGGKKK